MLFNIGVLNLNKQADADTVIEIMRLDNDVIDWLPAKTTNKLRSGFEKKSPLQKKGECFVEDTL